MAGGEALTSRSSEGRGEWGNDFAIDIALLPELAEEATDPLGRNS